MLCVTGDGAAFLSKKMAEDDGIILNAPVYDPTATRPSMNIGFSFIKADIGTE